jgi:hypothetical protein
MLILVFVVMLCVLVSHDEALWGLFIVFLGMNVWNVGAICTCYIDTCRRCAAQSYLA